MTIEELGQQVKNKYPNAYNNINDAELGQKILEKYPQYQSQVNNQDKAYQQEYEAIHTGEGSQQQTQEPQQQGFLSSLIQELAAPFKQIKKVEQESTKTTGGKIRNSLSFLLGPFGLALNAPKGEKAKTAGALAEIGSYAIPVGRAGQGAKALAKSGAITGAALLGSGAVRRGETRPVEIIKETASGALVGAVTGPLTKLAEPVQKVILGRAANLYNSVLGGITKDEAKAAAKGFIKTAGQKITERGGFVKATQRGVEDLADKVITQTEEKIQPLLKEMDNAGIRISTEDIIKPLQEIKDSLAAVGEPIPARIDGIINAIRSKGKEILPSEANNLKREYYNLMRNKNVKFNIPFDELQGAKQVWRKAASGIKEAIEKAGGERYGNAINELNAEQGLHLDIRNKIEDAIAKGEVKNIQDLGKLVTNLFGMAGGLRNIAVGAGLGVATGNPVVTGAYLALNKILTSTAGRTTRAKALIGTSKALPALVDLLGKMGVKISDQTQLKNILEKLYKKDYPFQNKVKEREKIIKENPTGAEAMIDVATGLAGGTKDITSESEVIYKTAKDLKKINLQDFNELQDFTAYVSGKWKPKNVDEEIKYINMIRNMAKHYRIKVGNTVAELSGNVEKYLDRVRTQKRAKGIYEK